MISTADDRHVLAIVALDGFAPRAWSETAWRAHMRSGDVLTVVSVEAGSGDVSGFAAFRTAGDVTDLLRVAVSPRHRRRHIGRALIDVGIDWALRMESSRMMLEVEPNNHAAVRLYRGLGFGDVTTRRDYYGVGSDALVMELLLATIDEPEWTGTNQ